MMHYIALVMAPVDAPVESVEAVGTPVIGPYEDIVNSRLLFSNGCVANVTASRISQKVERTMRIFQADEYTVADLQNRRLTRVRERPGADPADPLRFERLAEPTPTWHTLERAIETSLAERGDTSCGER